MRDGVGLGAVKYSSTVEVSVTNSSAISGSSESLDGFAGGLAVLRLFGYDCIWPPGMAIGAKWLMALGVRDIGLEAGCGVGLCR